jgi:hypothetical protein
MNRLLLENSNKVDATPTETSRSGPVPDWNQDQSLITIHTPQKDDDVRRIASQITGLQTADTATVRVLFRKVAKGIEEKDFLRAQHKRKIEQLEARVLQLAPRKRRKVQVSPNSKFANIEAIKRAQIVAEIGQLIGWNLMI